MKLVDRLIGHFKKREPDLRIHASYLNRWYVIPRNKWLNVYFHEFTGPDEGRYPHDHPWWSLGILLKGEYEEMVYKVSTAGGSAHFVPGDYDFFVRLPGSVTLRSPHWTHRVFPMTPAVYTIFITGPKLREWGFLTPARWIRWDKYENNGEVINNEC